MKNQSDPSFLALDLGAESGRAILGCLDGNKLKLQEIHRFNNIPIKVENSLHWDVLRLWSEMKLGLAAAVNQTGDNLISLGVDSWGVDFGLLDSTGSLLGIPFHYRDRRTNGMVEAVSSIIPCREIYEHTGNQIMPINSLFQLFSMVNNDPEQLLKAEHFLNIPDFFNFWFSGVKASELTISSTTQCFNPQTGNWAYNTLKKLKIPTTIFGNIIEPGTKMGELKKDIAGETGAKEIGIVAVASHDTQSAIAAVPSTADDFLYISSGTWSLMGVEVSKPIINDESFAAELTNEGGYGGRHSLLKNIVGLWILQECKREWVMEGVNLSYDELTSLAETGKAFRSLINPVDPIFLSPGKMVERIQRFCRLTHQEIPQTYAEIIRCILESLALEYRRVADQISALLKRDFTIIHIIGGGSKNRLLNQFTANSTGRMVIAGPVEATAIGNILVQAISLGIIGSHGEGREIIGNSFAKDIFEPNSTVVWNEAFQRYLSIKLEVE